MEPQLQFLHWIAGWRNEFLDLFFGTVTHLGSETWLILVAIFCFWCLDKKHAYYFFLVGFLGTVCNQFLKLVFRVERPWVLDPTLEPVASAVPDATGFSFPSGHTQSSVSLFGALARIARRPLVRVLCLIPILLVPFSRMYLGVHTPMDVLASVFLSLLLVFAFYPLVERAWGNHRRMACLLGGATLLAGLYLLYVLLFPFPADIDSANLASGVKNAYTLFGALLGICLVYFIDERYLHVDTRATLPVQLMKLVPGAILVFAVKELTRAPLTALLGAGPQNLVRYFLLVVFAGAVWPLTFRFFARLGERRKAPPAD